MDAIAQTIGLDGVQDEALKNARRIADQAADTLARDCHNDVPVEPSARLEAMVRGIDAVEAALSAVQPPLQMFYDSLNDDQKARLVIRDADRGGAETTGHSRRAAETGGRKRTKKPADDVPIASPNAPPWSCEQWQAELRAWPISRIEQEIAVGPRQRAAFYEFAASMQRSADALADSCPRGAALTMMGHLKQISKEREAVRQSAATVRPTLERFYEMLDGGQRARFSDAI